MQARRRESRMLSTIEDLVESPPQVLIVGSGPAATSVAEYLYTEYPQISTAILERGGLLLTSHVNNLPPHDVYGSPSRANRLDERREFIAAHEQYLWEGDFKDDGMMMVGLGGRGIVAGAHLRRFDDADFHLWPNARWPIGLSDLASYYSRAEVMRNVSAGECHGRPQVWLLGQLGQFRAYPPPWGIDVRSTSNRDVGRGYDSAMSLLWALLSRDVAAERNHGARRRLQVSANTYVTGIKYTGGRATGVIVRDALDPAAPETVVNADVVVLAASPIESARLALNSGLDVSLPAVGRYLADHVYMRGEIRVPTPVGDIRGEGVNVVLPPPDSTWDKRFQVEMRGEADGDHPGVLRLRATGIAATEPESENRVTLSRQTDEFGVRKAHISYAFTRRDEARNSVMRAVMHEVAEALGGRYESEPEILPPGRSHHEVGTLRMGIDPAESVVDRHGRVHGLSNLFVSDASVFPSVGVANPMLTITAWGYRVANAIGSTVLVG